MNKKIKIAIIIAIILIFGYAAYYLADYSHADSSVEKYLNGTDNVSVVKTSNGLFLDGSGNDTALIFYPGGKVEYTSYLPLLSEISSRGVDCYLVEMPLNIAFLGANSADDIISNSSYDHYFIAGHSLGGVSASSYVNETNKTDGVILLAAYPTKEMHKPVLSIYGSNDGVLNMEKYDDAKSLMKDNFTESIIDGANHAQFGNYGNQSGDNPSNITSKDQQKQCADEIIKFIEYFS